MEFTTSRGAHQLKTNILKTKQEEMSVGEMSGHRITGQTNRRDNYASNWVLVLGKFILIYVNSRKMEKPLLQLGNSMLSLQECTNLMVIKHFTDFNPNFQQSIYDSSYIRIIKLQ